MDMQSATALRRPTLSSTTIAVFAAILLAFVLGGLTGYAVKALNTQKALSTSSVATVSGAPACPQRMHAVVSYTAQTWTCEANPER
jgi:hypothetical protein